jgi:hypothetical protein
MQSDLISEQPFSYLHVGLFCPRRLGLFDSLIQREFARAAVAGPTVALYAPIIRPNCFFFFESFCRRRTEPICDPTAQQVNPSRRPDHNLDRNGVDDGTGATAAPDIHPRDGSSGTGRPHSNRAGIVGSPDQRKL